MKTIRAILVIFFIPWVLVLGLLVTLVKCFFGLITKQLPTAITFVKWFWWSLLFDLQLFIKTGRILMFAK